MAPIEALRGLGPSGDNRGVRSNAKRAFFEWHRARVHGPRVDRVAAALARVVGPARSILDVGAGDGAIGVAVAAAVGATEVAGVDVAVRASTRFPIRPFNGTDLPFEDGAFEVVVLSDVLHHAAQPERLLGECLRVAGRAVALKDHLRFGEISRAVLWAMDAVGNAEAKVPVTGRYWSATGWAALVDEAGGRFIAMEWPLRIHDLPFRIVTRDALQFVAAIAPARPSSRAA